MRWWVRIRVGAARRPWPVWVLAGLCGLGAFLVGRAQWHTVADARASWGESRRVLVAVGPVAPGTPLDTAAVEWRDLPHAAVPDEAVLEIASGAVVTRVLGRGEVVVSADLTTGDTRFALAPDGAALLAVPVSGNTPLVRPGDRALVAVAGLGGGFDTALTVTVTVVAVGGGSVVVAASADDAGRLAAALADPSRIPGIAVLHGLASGG